MVEPGQVLAGKYRVERVLGRGGMGVVVEAHHIQLDERVAIKFLLPEAVANQEAVARFLREARAAIKIKGHHVARITDVGTLDSGAPYMVMEYLQGQDLAGIVAEHGALPVEQAVDLVVQTCEAIAEAHVLGIVHRDLKPANLFCVRGPDGLPTIKVLDFGISKMTTADGLDVTRTTALLGSPLYMSPEQMTSAKTVDSRADIWALGVVLYELLAGRPPFDGETLPELSVRIATEAPLPLRNFRPDLPDGVEAIVFRCLEKNRDQRYGNVAELATALAEFAPKRVKILAERIARIIDTSGLSHTAPELQTPQGSRERTVSGWGQTGAGGEHGSGRGRGAALAIGAVLLVGLGITAFELHSHKGVAPPPTSATPAAAASHPAPTRLERPPGSAQEPAAPGSEAGPANAAPLVASGKPQHSAPKRATGTRPSHPVAPTKSAKPAPTDEFGGRL